MNRITENPTGERFLSELQQRPSRKQDARLLRQGMRTLLLAGNFGDLSVAGPSASRRPATAPVLCSGGWAGFNDPRRNGSSAIAVPYCYSQYAVSPPAGC